MIRFRAGKRHGAGSTPGSYSETTSPRLADPSRELRMRGRVVAVDAAAEHGDRRAAGFERSAVSLAVDPARHAAHDDETRCGSSRASERATERPYDEHARAPTTATAGRASSAAVRSRGGTAAAADRGSPRAAPETPRRGGGCAGSRSRRGELSGHAVRERLGDVAGSTAAAPASAAIVRATRATRARPRPESGSRSTALERSSEQRPFGAAATAADARAHRALGPHARRRLGRRRGELGRARPRHRDGEVEPVEQRARELLPVCGEPLRRARALDGGIATSAARAHVHRPDELEPRREHRVPADARDRDERRPRAAAAATRARARELRQLVHEQHASVRERDLARTRARAAADDRRRRRSVMGSAEGRHGHERPPAAADRRPSGCASPRAPPPRQGGRMPGSRRASMVLPVPGGPISRRLCAPAAAISSARRARSWPRSPPDRAPRRPSATSSSGS